MKNIKSILIIAALCGLAVAAGWYIGFKKSFSEVHVEENATVMMEKVEKVFKFVAAEGHISDIYDYKDYQYYDISPFRKKILVRVNAKVLVGYDFENVDMIIDEENKTMIIDSLGQPTILAIDHDLDYYDIQEGTFNYFSEKELTEITAKAKNYATSMVEESDLYRQAAEQKQDLLDMLRVALYSTGWDLEVGESVLKN